MYLSDIQIQNLRNYFSKLKYIISVTLYGSYAQGAAGPNSDIDLLVKLDYQELKRHGIEFLAIPDELKQLLDTPVSITTTLGLSPYIEDFLSKDSVVIYNVDPKEIEEFPFVSMSFEKSMFRDKARLEHILQSLNLVKKWTDGMDTEQFLGDAKNRSACKRELQVATSLNQQLSKSTLIDFTTYTSNLTEKLGSGKDFFRILKNGAFQYFGTDDLVLFDVLDTELKGMINLMQTVLNNWENSYKNKLGNYFVSYLINRINSEVRDKILKDGEFNNIRETIEKTVLEKKLIQLTPSYVSEGERNLDWFSGQLNIKKIWKEILNSICPFFPIC